MVQNNKGYIKISVAVFNFGKFGWTVLTEKSAHTLKISSEKIHISSRRNPKLIKTDDGIKFVNTIFTEFQNRNGIKRCSRYSSKRSVFAKILNKTFRDCLSKPVFEKNFANWIDEKSSVTKQYNSKKHFLNNIKPIQASLTKIEDYVYTHNFNRKKKENETKS